MAELTPQEIENIKKARQRLDEQKLKNEVLQDIKSKEKQEKLHGNLTRISGILLTTFFSVFLFVYAVIMLAGNTETRKFLRFSEQLIAKFLKWLFTNVITNMAVIDGIAFVISFAFLITCLVFASNLIAISNKKLEKFKNSKIQLIVYMAFFLIWLITPISLVINVVTPIAYISILIVVAGVSLIVIDLVKTKKLKTDAVNSVVSDGSKIEVVKKTKMVNEKQSSMDNSVFELELQKIKDLKDKNLITEEDFNLLKQNLINKKIK